MLTLLLAIDAETLVALAPVITTIGWAPALTASSITCCNNVFPLKGSNCFMFPNRDDSPAAKMIMPVLFMLPYC
jgi:hypothetical protein